MKAIVVRTYKYIHNFFNASKKRVLKGVGIENCGDHFFYIKKINTTSTVVDLGANKGHFSKNLEKYKLKKLVIVEANKELIDGIQIQGATKINKAIADKEGTITFYFSGNDEAGSIFENISDQFSLLEKRDIPCMTFTQLLVEHNIGTIDLLKIDIEGAELQLLDSITDIQLSQISQIAVEFHDFLDKNQINPILKIKGRLEELGWNTIKFSTLDYRQVLFINKKSLTIDIPLSYYCYNKASVLVDFFYYKIIGKINKLQV